MAMIEIEAPTEAQKAAAGGTTSDSIQERILAHAAAGATEVEILTRLAAERVPLETAKEMVPAILEVTKGMRRRGKLIRLVGGGLLAIGGIGVGLHSLAGGVLWIWPFLIGFVGIAFMSGYIKNPFEHI